MNPENEAKLIRPRPQRLGGLAVACMDSLLADPGRRPCAIFLTSHSSATRHQWLNLFSTRHECFTSDVGLTRTRLVSCILLTSLITVKGSLLSCLCNVLITPEAGETQNIFEIQQQSSSSSSDCFQNIALKTIAGRRRTLLLNGKPARMSGKFFETSEL